MIIKHILDHTADLLTAVLLVPPFHVEQVTALPMTCEAPVSCLLTASLTPSLPGSLFFTCSAPHSSPLQGLCTCFPQLGTFLLCSTSGQAPFHGSGLCADVTSSRRPSLITLDKATPQPRVTLIASSKYLSLRHQLAHFGFTCSCSGSSL